MAKVNNEKFGIISNMGEMHLIRKMGVPENNIDLLNQSRGILNRMSAGDILCVPSVKSFAVGAYDLFSKMQYLSNNGVEFQSGIERYLNFSPIKPLSSVTLDTLKNFAVREQEFVRWINTSKLDAKAKSQLVSRIQWETILDIALVFCNNGIKKKGN